MTAFATNQIAYELRAVAFLDIAGFKALVASSTSHESALKELQQLVLFLDSAVPLLNASVSPSVAAGLIPRHTYISDCIILSAPLSVPGAPSYNGLEILVMRCIQLFHFFLSKGYLLSGAVEMGQVWHADANIVGPAYQDAFLLQEKVKDPKIVLSEQAAARWGQGICNGSRMCLQEGGGVIVNGLFDAYIPESEKYGAIEKAYDAYQAIIARNVGSLSGSPKSKWLWLEQFLTDERSELSKWPVACLVRGSDRGL